METSVAKDKEFQYSSMHCYSAPLKIENLSVLQAKKWGLEVFFIESFHCS